MEQGEPAGLTSHKDRWIFLKSSTVSTTKGPMSLHSRKSDEDSILSSTITPRASSPHQGDLQREPSKACLACCQLPVALLHIAPKERYCFNKIYSKVNWSRKIPITGSNSFPLDQLEYNPSAILLEQNRSTFKKNKKSFFQLHTLTYRDSWKGKSQRKLVSVCHTCLTEPITTQAERQTDWAITQHACLSEDPTAKATS